MSSGTYVVNEQRKSKPTKKFAYVFLPDFLNILLKPSKFMQQPSIPVAVNYLGTVIMEPLLWIFMK
ncbi:hypothetical protein MUB24_04360 [Lederbergia sp. NSJ-179]|uniref:hypothetical protein n=1 Tax=Lederbergia sp. NSJ-179 TaxID=2931402 RepID=UPI001FD53C81|nr:hypothetical protein [Lederbergia sp. NSJ-179]MCJ7840155.1 hypothetical protein [Lederbergia sp. NSJ-179]